METLKFQDHGANLNWDYDAEADGSSISIGEPESADSVDSSNRIIIRVHPQNKVVVGLTMIGLTRCVIERMLNHMNSLRLAQ